jgi:hypothetical protein
MSSPSSKSPFFLDWYGPFPKSFFGFSYFLSLITVILYLPDFCFLSCLADSSVPDTICEIYWSIHAASLVCRAFEQESVTEPPVAEVATARFKCEHYPALQDARVVLSRWTSQAWSGIRVRSAAAEMPTINRVCIVCFPPQPLHGLPHPYRLKIA